MADGKSVKGKNEAPVSFLASLKFSSETRPRKNEAKTRSPRETILDFLRVQASCVDAEIAGKAPFSVVKERYQQGDDGKRVKTSVSVTPRTAYWQGQNGYRIALSYANVPVELSPGHPSVICGPTLEDVRKTIFLLMEAVTSGEADPAIEAAAAKARQMRRKAA